MVWCVHCKTEKEFHVNSELVCVAGTAKQLEIKR
jgi:hypothetical protein